MPASTICASLPYPLDSDPPDVSNDIRLLAEASDAFMCGIAKLPLGSIIPYLDTGATLDDNWLRLEGQMFDPVEYPNLSSYLGGGSTLPDLRGRFLRGTGGNFNTPGGLGGWDDAVVVAHDHAGPSHTHSTPNHSHSGSASGGQHVHTAKFATFSTSPTPNGYELARPDYRTSPTPISYNVTKTSGSHSHTVTIPSSGAGVTGAGGTQQTGSSGLNGANRNLPPFMNVTFIIKATP